jgi:hypothetical protein
MSLINDSVKPTSGLSTVSKYTVLNGVIYVGAGVLLIVWPRVTQVIFRDAAFVRHEEALIRVLGMTLLVIGWLYLAGGRTDGREFSVATVVDRLVFVPVVLLPLVIAGVFPHLFLTFLILDPALAIGAWWLLSRKTG